MKNQKNSEQSQQTKKYYETILQLSNDGILITDAGRNIIEVNDVFCSFIGQDRKVVIDSNLFKWLEGFPGDSAESWIKLEQAIHSKQVVSNCEFQLLLKNEIHYFGVNASLIEKIEDEEKGIIISNWHDISACKTAEQALEKSEEKFKLIADSSSDIITLLTFDLKASFIYVSTSVTALVGYKPEDLLGKSCFDFIHPADKKELIPLLKKYIGDKLKKLITGKESTYTETIEFRFKNKKGNWRLMQSTMNFAGNQLLAITRDITERKKMEEAVRESEQELNAIFNGARDGIALLDKTGKILRINKRILEVGGFTEKEIVGKHIIALKMFPKKSILKMTSIWGKLIKGPEISFEVEVYTKKGEKKIIQFHTSPLKKDGKVKGVIAILRDVTERNNADALIKESAANLESLIENRKDSIWSVDNNFNYIFCNSFFVKAYLAAYNIKLQKGINAVDAVPPELRKFWKLKYEAAFAGENIVFVFSQLLGSSDHYFQVSLNPIITDGSITGVSAVSIDITERKQAEEELVKHREHLEELVKERTAEIEEKNERLEYYNKLFVGREFRIKELRDKVKELDGKISDKSS